MLSFRAKGKTQVPMDDSDFLWPDGFFLALEDTFNLLLETGKKIVLEWGYKACYREHPTSKGRVLIREKYHIPTNPQTTDQQLNRGKFAAAIIEWQALPFTEQVVWNKLKYPAHMSGYNRFLRNYMLTN